jgi:hypothetical protein
MAAFLQGNAAILLPALNVPIWYTLPVIALPDCRRWTYAIPINPNPPNGIGVIDEK